MNKKIKRILISSSLICIMGLIGSCSDVLNLSSDSQNNPRGFVKIYLDAPDIPSDPDADTVDAALVVSRTVFPNAAPANNYYFKFIGISGGNPNGKVIEKTVTGSNPGTITLETGNWKVEVTRYETSVTNPVQFGTSAEFVIEANLTTGTNVYMAPVSGGLGAFSYTIIPPESGVTASLLVQPVGSGSSSGFSSMPVPPGGLSGSLSLPDGSYDVSVFLVKGDGTGASLYETAIIYSGLTTHKDFNFSSNQFYQYVYIQGALDITFSGGISAGPGENVIITAYKTGTNTPAGPAKSFSWTPVNNSWIIPIEPNNASVELAAEITGSDGVHYISRNLAAVNNIPVTGVFGVPLESSIFTITINGAWDSAFASITPKVSNVTRNAASPGETVNLAITSLNGLKPGSLKILLSGSSVEIPVSISGNNYSFQMPQSDVSVNAIFYTLLSSLYITDVTLGFDPSITTYSETVPADLSSVTVYAVAQDSHASISGTGDKVVSFGMNTVTVTVTPWGGTPADARDYTINLTREPYLTGLSVDCGSLSPGFDEEVTSYTVTGVRYGVNSIVVTAAAPLGVTITGGGTCSLAASGSTNIDVTAKAADGMQKNYSITVIKSAPLVTNTLSGISLYDGDDNLLAQYSDVSDPVPDTITLTVDNSVDHIIVDAVPSDAPFALVNVIGGETLTAGIDNTVFVQVIPESGLLSDSKRYTIVVFRE